MSDQSPPSEPDQLGWLMGEVDRLRAELEQARKDHEHTSNRLRVRRDEVHGLRAELEQARKERERMSSIVIDAWAKDRTSLADARAELEQARKERDEAVVEEAFRLGERNAVVAELEQARGTCPHSNCDAQRYRDALERIATVGKGLPDWRAMAQCARDALAGDK